jgi:hypothetical protein
MNKRKVLSLEIVTDDAGKIPAEARREVLRGERQLFRSHVVRRRIDEIAGKVGRLRHACDVGGVDAIRQYEFDLRCIRFAVPAEAVGAERKGERRKARVVRRVREAIGARRQQAR